tara:strand:- start:625 stop:819 length:195 start_codon:yes stop_codon:yes gene_type:complete
MKANLLKSNKMKQGHTYFLNVMLSTINKRMLEVEEAYKDEASKYIAYKTMLEQISEQYNKSKND